MAHINRRYIDKHWLMFIIRGGLAAGFSCFLLFGGGNNIESVIAVISVFLLFMGIVDAVGALYSSTRKHGWINSVIDALIDVAAAITLLFLAQTNLVSALIILSVYTVASGIIDIFHGFLSTVDPTDRFIRIIAGACGCIIGAVIINSGEWGLAFARFFGAYLLTVGITSMIYGVHNRAQKIEDKIARKEAVKKATAKRATSKKSPAKKSFSKKVAKKR